MTIFDRIKKLAKERSKTLRQVTDDLNLSQNYIYNLKKSGKQPNATTLTKLADYFNVSVDYLLGREKEDNTDKDIDEALDEAMSYNGKPLTQHDREVMKQLLKAYLENK